MFKLINYFILLLLLMASSSANAIVNIEKVGVNNDTKDFQAEIDLSTSGAKGNSDYQSTSFGSRFQWKDVSTQFLVLKSDYAKSFDVRSKNSTFMHYRYIVNPQSSLTMEYFVQLEDNEFKLLKLRSLFGGGARFSLFNTDERHQGRLGLGLFDSREEIDDTTQTVENIVRLNVYFTYQYNISKQVNFITTSYYQPDLSNESDYRFLEQMGFEFRISENFKYFISLDVSYDNEPVDGLEKNDSSYKSGINYRF